MAIKLTHKTTGHEVRFGNRDSAVLYAENHGGGLANWAVSTVPEYGAPQGVSGLGLPGAAGNLARD